MGLFRRAASSLAALLGRRRFEEELDQELAFHLEMETENLIDAGWRGGLHGVPPDP